VKKILFTVMAVVLCIGLVGGAFAYFSDTEESTGNTFTAGTLDLKLNDGDPDEWDDGASATWVSPDGWAPGDTVDATLRMTNQGSTGSTFLYLKPTLLEESDNGYNDPEGESSANNIADYINVTNFQITFKDSVSGDPFLTYGNWAPGWMTTCGAWGTTAPLTLREFQETIWWVVLWGSSRSDDVLEADGANIIELNMTLQFEPTAPNDYQSDQCVMTFEAATGSEYPLELHEIWHGSGGYGYATE
jgi:predicted ribosomally synthesized peptide with SipW-like signal peptide